ncbi:Cyclic nucleotide-binding domain-containing protein [Plasmodiophora brassicae]
MTTTRGKYVVAPMPLPTAWGAVKEELTSTSDEQHSDNKLVSDESKGVSVRDGDEIYGRPRHQSLVSMIASRLRVSLFESAHSRASSSTTISKRLSVVRESESAAYGSNQQPHVVIVNPKSDDGDDDDEDVVVESEEALHGPVIFAPDSPFVTVWLTILTAMITFAVYAVPFETAFETDSVLLTAVSIVIDAFFILDIVRKFRTGFMDEGRLIRDPARIRKHYLNGSFAIDLVASVPMDIIRLWLPHTSPILGANKLMSVFHCVLLIRDLEHSRDVNLSLVRVTKLIIYAVLLCHYVACIWFGLGWIEVRGFGENNWLPSRELLESSLLQQYLSAMYFAVGLMFSQAETPQPVTNLEIIFTLAVSLISIMLLAYVVGSIDIAGNALDDAWVVHDQKRHYCQRFLKQHKISKGLQLRIQNHYRYLWSKHNSLISGSEIDRLPHNLKTLVVMHILKDMFDSMPFLNSMSPAAKRCFVSSLRQRYTVADEVICTQDAKAQNLFFMKSGRVSLLYCSSAGRYTRTSILTGQTVFGEVAILPGERYIVTAQALSPCELYCLSHDKWQTLARLYAHDTNAVLGAFKARIQAQTDQNRRIEIDQVERGDAEAKKARARWRKIRYSVWFTVRGRRRTWRQRAQKTWHIAKTFTIHPLHPMWQRWETIVLLVIVAMSVRLSVLLSTNESLVTPGGIAFDTVSNAIMFVDLILRFRLCVSLPNGTLEVAPRNIERRFLRSRQFWWYLIGCVPAGVAMPSNPWMRINKLVWVSRLNALLDQQLHVYFEASLAQLMKMTAHFLAVVHVTTCGYLIVNTFDGYGARNDATSWAIPFNLSHSTPGSRYSHGLFFSLKVLIRIGSLAAPTTTLEFVYTIATSIAGLFVVGYVIGRVGNLIARIDVADNDFHHRVRRTDAILSTLNVPVELRTDAFRFFQYEDQSNRGVDPEVALGDLPLCLRQDVMMEICGKILMTSALFEKVSASMLRPIVGHMTFVSIPAEQFIFQNGDIGDSVYFILKGLVGLVLPGAIVPVKFLHPGTCFGEAAMLSGGVRSASIIAIEPTHLVRLDKAHFATMLEDHPDFVKRIQNVVQHRRHEFHRNDPTRNSISISRRIQQKIRSDTGGSEASTDQTGAVSRITTYASSPDTQQQHPVADSRSSSLTPDTA